MDPPFMGLAVFASFWSQHDLSAQRLASAPLMAGGLSFVQPLVLRHRVMSEDLALEDPDLDAAHAIGGFGGAVAEIDVGAQCMQRYPSFAIPFHPGDLSAAQPSRAVDPDPLRAEPHSRLHGPLHRPAKGDPAFQLLCDTVGNQLRVDFRFADLDDVESDFAIGDLGEIGAQLFDVDPLFPNHHAGPGRMQRDPRAPLAALDYDAREASLAQPPLQELPQAEVVEQQVAVFLAREPTCVPGPVT